MTDIRFRFKKTEEFVTPQRRNEKEEHIIHSKIFEVFMSRVEPNTVESLINLDTVFLKSLDTFKSINDKICVGEIKLTLKKHYNLSNPEVYNYDYGCNIYSQAFTVVSQDFKSIDKNNIRTACYIEKQQEIFILEFDLANDSNILLEIL